MLKKGGRKLFEVAKSVGYDSDAAFSKAFKRTFGAAPRKYRRDPATLQPREPHHEPGIPDLASLPEL